MITRKQLLKEIRRIDPSEKAGSPQHDTYMILLAGLAVGPNIKKIAKFLQMPREKVAKRGRRLRSQGVWSGSRIKANWFEKNGGIAFVMDACVADGLMKRA